MKLTVSLALAILTSGAFAADELTVKTVEVKNRQSITPKYGYGDVAGAGAGGIGGPGTFPDYSPTPETPTERVGKIIQAAKDVVALGQDTYNLVQKGKPSNTTEYAPISIVPKDPLTKEVVSAFDMEDCSMPVKKTFITTMSTAGMEVVRFEYMVIFTHSCSYEGAGKYIQTAMVQPVSVKTKYGWDLNASMKLSGIMNHGKKGNPVVGALLTMKYSMNSWRTAFERNDTIHIKGNGEIKVY